MDAESTPTQPSANTVDSPTASLTFDAEICRRFQDLGDEMLRLHPELRSFAVVLDYQGELNDAQVSRGVWRGRGGLVRQLDELYGSLQQTQRLARIQHQRILQYIELLKQEAIETVKSLEAAVLASQPPA